MYVILISDDNTMSAPKKQRIIQKSKLVDDFYFLVKPIYNGYDMSTATVLLEYLTPTSKRYKTETLVLSNEKYEDYLKYILPVDTEFTEEAGLLELQLSFIYVNIDVDGKIIQRVRKIAPVHKVNIVPISAWSDIIPDDALTALDQRIIKLDTQIKALDDMNTIINDTKADNIVYEDDKLQLTANGNRIGNIISINSCENDLENGVPVVDFNKSNTNDSEDENGLHDNVIEF